MKPLLVPALTLGLLTCLGALFVQHRHYATITARQADALAAARAELDALRGAQSQSRQVDARRQITRSALAQARSLSTRYASLDAAPAAARPAPKTYTRVSK
jgi:hypothetical protein